MADDAANLLEQAYGPQSASTTDVLGQYRAPVKGYLGDFIQSLGSEALARQAEPNILGRVLQAIPSEAMLAANMRQIATGTLQAAEDWSSHQ